MSRYHALVEARHGSMIVNRHDAYVGRSFLAYGEFSEGEVDLFRHLVDSGSVVLEIGANFGAHTVPLAQMAHWVYALEPQRLAFQALCGNVALNSLSNVSALPFAAGHKTGSILVPMLDPDQPNNIGGLALGRYEIGERTAAVTVDSLNLSDLHFLKVDVEGMECEVLRGAVETIRAHRPVMYLENDRKEREAELFDLLRALGYRAWWHTPPLYNPDNYRQNPENVFDHIVSINLLCFHRDEMPSDPPQGLREAV